jgi:hypothetical protein
MPESNFAVAEIFKPYAIEIRLPDIDGKILAPIIGTRSKVM